MKGYFSTNGIKEEKETRMESITLPQEEEAGFFVSIFRKRRKK